MGAPFRKTDPQSRKYLLAELNRIGRQVRTPNEQMIASFVQCEKAQKASKVVAAVLDWAFSSGGFAALQARVKPANERSQRMCSGLGFSLKPQADWLVGKLTRAQWQARR